MSKSHHFAISEQKTPPFGLFSFQIGLSRLPKNGTFRFSLPFQTTDFLATLRYSQYNDSLAKVEYADSEGKVKKEYHSHDHYISGSVTFTNKPSAKDFSWSTGGTAARNIETVRTSLKSTIDPDDNYKEKLRGTSNYIYASFFYNFGYIVLRSANARVHVGNNASVNAYIYDLS